MLTQSLGLLYATHMMMETLNSGVSIFMVTMALQMVAHSSCTLYLASLHLEMVWLLVPTAAVLLLIARVVATQCSEEELALYSYQRQGCIAACRQLRYWWCWPSLCIP